MKSRDHFYIPCHMIEIKKLQEFFEQKALEGYSPVEIDDTFQCAAFDKEEPEPRHYCVYLLEGAYGERF